MPELKSDRRQLLRAGAWTVPVVAVASAAPAFATSLKADLTRSTAVDPAVKGRGSANRTIRVRVTVSNADGTGPTTGLTAAITIPKGLKNADSQTGPSGWNTTAPTVSGQTVTYTRDSQLAAGQAVPEVEFVIQRKGNGGRSVSVDLDSRGVADVDKLLTVRLV